MDQDITISSLIKAAAEEAAKQEPEEKKEEKKEKSEDKKEEVEKVSYVLTKFADYLEKTADELPLDLAPVPGEQPKTQDKPLAEHDLSAGGAKQPDNEMKTDERDPVKETQGHLGQPQKPFKPVTPDAPAAVINAPAKKVASYLQDLQRTKYADALGYDSNPQAANDRSAELLDEVNQVGYTAPTDSSGKVDSNQQAVDDTKKDLVEPAKKDMKQLLDEPMQSKKTDKVLAEALPVMEPKAEPKIAAKKSTATDPQKGKAVGGAAGALGGAGLGAAIGGRGKVMRRALREQMQVGRKWKPIGKITSKAIRGSPRLLRGALLAGAGALGGGMLGGALGKRVGKSAEAMKKKTASEDLVSALRKLQETRVAEAREA